MKRRTKRVGLFSAGVVAVLALAMWPGSASSELAPVIVRGAQVDIAAFAIAAVNSPSVVAAVSDAYWDGFLDCMAERGFEQTPDSVEAGDEYAEAYGQEAIGSVAVDETGRLIPPAPQQVDLPNGEKYEFLVTWTPETCAWQSWEQLGSDPIYREAVRQKVMMLGNEADSATVDDDRLSGAFETISECSGTQVDPWSVLETLDGRSRFWMAGRPDVASAGCITAEVGDQVRQVRAEHNIRVASSSLGLMDAWASLVDSEARVLGLPTDR